MSRRCFSFGCQGCACRSTLKLGCDRKRQERRCEGLKVSFDRGSMTVSSSSDLFMVSIDLRWDLEEQVMQQLRLVSLRMDSKRTLIMASGSDRQL